MKSAEVVCLYFSANWCSFCKTFTEQLLTFVNEVNKDGKKLQIVLVSQDQTEVMFKAYYEQ